MIRICVLIFFLFICILLHSTFNVIHCRTLVWVKIGGGGTHCPTCIIQSSTFGPNQSCAKKKSCELFFTACTVCQGGEHPIISVNTLASLCCRSDGVFPFLARALVVHQMSQRAFATQHFCVFMVRQKRGDGAPNKFQQVATMSTSCFRQLAESRTAPVLLLFSFHPILHQFRGFGSQSAAVRDGCAWSRSIEAHGSAWGY